MPKNDLTSGSWLFLGPEIGEKQIAIDEIREKNSYGGTGEETVFYAGETNVSTMVSIIQNGSLFADKRLFIIKSAESFRKKDELDLLASCIASPPPDTSIILVSEETGIAKALEAAIPPARKRIFWELPDGRKTEWVRSFFTREGFKINSEGIETILELVENNTAALQQECSRLILFLDKNREITGEEAEKWLSHTREESPFTLFSRIAAGDFSRCLESVRTLLAAKETPVAIFAGLAFCFRKLMSYLMLKEAGITDEWEYKKIGVSSPVAKRDYSAAGRRYTSTDAETCLALTAEYDLLLRSSFSFPEQILMDRYLYKIYTLGLKER
ncbi:MAG: DNA polymerase III subunit delta [Treponema sp.]|nr:DNA polymerase III subunit delta [Treponema sp.]